MDASDLLSAGVLRWVGLGAVVLAAAWLVKRLVTRPEEDPHHVHVRCACGWVGKVSRYKLRCSKCGAPVTPP